MSPGANKRQTGTVPKEKASRKNSVPQEIVAPTRRDLQQHLNDFFASVQRASKRDNNNRTPGEGTCFELENFSLPENTRSCWPVRPIPRRSYLQDAVTNNEVHSTGNTAASSSTNAAIGVVIPTTPNSTLHQQQNQLNEQLLHHNQQLLSMRVPDGAPQPTRTTVPFNNEKSLPMEDRLSQIQDYIRITTSLIDSINVEKANAPRPQSVSSVHTTAPNTPTYEELQTKLEVSNRSILHIKEQQQQLIRLQQAAKNQLYEMEQLRNNQQPMTFPNNQNAVPDYDNVEDVTQDVTSLMSRMKTLTDFIHSQNDLANSLGLDQKSDLIEEQTQLQKKLVDLKNKKQQMANLVSELHAMNIQAENNFDDMNRSTTVTPPPRNVNDESFDTVQVPGCEFDHNGKIVLVDQPTRSNDADDEDDDDEVAAAAGSVLQDKIAEINAMKDQLKRLQNMMHTVKLIEIKNGDFQPDDEVTIQSQDEPNNIQSNDDPQRDEEEEQEMAERVRVLHNMTNDLREQAVTLAAERDRLKDIKNEMARRREFDGSEKNLKQQQTHQINPQPSTSAGQKEQILDSNFLQKKNDVEKSIPNEIQRINKEPLQSADGLLYSPNNWSNRQNASTPSLRSDNLSHKPNPNICNNQGKDSADSGAVDMLNMSIEAGSLQSCSSRGYSVPPPMRTISARDASWRKSSQEIPRISSLNNQANGVYENQTEQNYPWYWNNYNQACSSAAPQSPHCHYHHHMCAMQTSNPANDPMLMQQFIQTQQMLINSISQCNQLLWDQQREINTLNSAVLLIQERLLNGSSNSMVDATQQNIIRAESVPPNIVCTNQAPFLPRAHSEQPQNFPNYPQSSSASIQQQQQQPQSPISPSPFRQYTNTPQNAQFYRNNQQGVRLLRQPLLNSRTGVAAPFYETDQIQYSNNFLNAHNLSNHTNDNSGSPNNATINNLHQQNLTNASNSATPVTNNSVNATNTVTALNNQVVPGIRANNYYDNFRSYSRQNLLSSASCKSNEIEQAQAHITHNNLPFGNKFRNQINQNTPPDVLNVNQQRYYHDHIIESSNTNNYNNLKLSVGSVSAPTAAVASILATSIGAQMTATNTVAINTNTAVESNLLNSIANNSHTNNENRCGDDQKSINSFNFDVNELKQPKMSTKTLQKGTTGGSKRVRPLRDMSAPLNERENQFGTASVNGIGAMGSQDLNLASSSNQRTNLKSSSKLFDDLKENVYLEVSALIAANESRPHFLINLFRELQLISSSDPLRKRLMQAFQEVYTQHCESNGSPNILPDMQASVSNVQNDLENPHHQEVTQHSGGQHFNDRDGANNLSVTTTCVPDLRSSIDEALLRAITTNPIQNEATNSCSYLDLTVKHDSQNGSPTSKGNSIVTPTSLADVVAMDANMQHTPNIHPSTLQFSAPVCMVSHLNQELAEADQSMENDVANNENVTNSPDTTERNDLIPDNGCSNEGAVGGVESTPPPLPDLAKVTTTSNCEIDFVDTDL
ncbi:putative uncharacterized protein DDB_G0277255 isoform X2 [Contarinia nasturtii]|uniref:putative uncharacterized protein DDB_G0277255 isoform X2 n=1 Tax=Contarinia nasturtii TaxID=265458 RepID=UPI0012D492B5|nr:putative uncharacterized protein DDB_G0277255 isoform X2 [Contarinia nasturtii]